MKKLLLIALLAVAFTTHAQTITVGEGSGLTAEVPFNTFYNYSFTEQLYLANEIEFSGFIKAIKFRIAYSYNSEHPCEVDVYLKNVWRNAFADGSDYEPVSEEDKVFSGHWIIPADVDDWITIEFDTPFHYNGTDNLLIAIDENSDDYAMRYFRYTEVMGSVLNYGSDTDNPNPYELDGFSGLKEVGDRRANVKLVFGTVTNVAENEGIALSVIPNPANDVLFLEGANNETVSIYDANGRLVMQERYQGSLNISRLDAGVYAIATAKGVVRFVKK